MERQKENIVNTTTQRQHWNVRAGNNSENIGAKHHENDQIVEDSIVGDMLGPKIHENTNGSSICPENAVNAIPSSGKEVVIVGQPRGVKRIEIVKSIVYGGLTELITSLSIVISAASINATTGKILALSFSSLIVGLFVLGYKIDELWMSNNQRVSNETNAEVDRYEELLGDRQNYRLHYLMAILSYLFFGLVPPFVYVFTFCEPEDEEFKMLTVVGVSFSCIMLLAIVKAHIQRPENCLKFVKIIGSCIFDGVGASVVISLAAGIIENYIEQYSWFEQPNNERKFVPCSAIIRNDSIYRF